MKWFRGINNTFKSISDPMVAPASADGIIGIPVQLVPVSKLIVVTFKLVPSFPIGSYSSILSVWIQDVCVCLSVYPSSCPCGFVFD